jgi:hypothetical protein
MAGQEPYGQETPSSPCSCRSTARSCFSPVASQAWLMAKPRAAEYSVKWQ